LRSKEELRTFNIHLAEGRCWSAMGALARSVQASPSYVLKRMSDEFLSSRIANGIRPEIFFERRKALWL
jgi:hypothetical protein